MVAAIRMGLAFYSRLPAGKAAHDAPSLNRMAPVLAPVGLVIGALPAGFLLLAAGAGLPASLAALGAVGILAMVTGAMAEDGLADSLDGLWGGNSREKRLQIMRDSRQGTYGVLAIVLLVGARWGALNELVALSPSRAAALWMAAQIVARQAALWLAVSLPVARTNGAAHGAGQLAAGAFWQGMVLAGIVAIALAVPFLPPAGIFWAGCAGALSVFGWRKICQRKIGGYSGDVIGGLQGLVEIALLWTFILFI